MLLPGGLSIGAKTGSGVGISIAAIALPAIGVLLGKRRSRRHTVGEADVGHGAEFKDTPGAQSYGDPAYGNELRGNEHQRHQQCHEMQTDPAGIDHRYELPTMSPR
jgi:hypothetical protein